MRKKYAILIVDDNVDLAGSLGDVLETESYDVTISHNGQDALAVCRQKNVDLALIDIKLPDTSGTELIEELAGLYSDMEYIIITGYASLDSAVNAVSQKRVVGYLTKPFSMGHILILCNQTLARKRAEAALKESEERFHSVAETAVDAIISADSHGTIVYWNNAAETIFGFSADEAVGKPITIIIPKRLRKAHQEGLERVISTGEIKIIGRVAEVVGLRKDGSEFPIELALARWKTESEQFFTAIIRDITERNKMQEQLMVNDRLASIGELVSGVAHELNNPLTGVIGFSDLLVRRKDLPDDVKEDIKIINREAQRTANIVKNLLTFARKHPKEKQLTQINSAIQAVLELRAYEQNVNNIQVNAQLAPDLPAIMANTFDLQQVFLNILVNAEYAMLEAQEGGTITISTERDGDTIRASFTDDGPGISQETLGHLFDPFFTTKEVGKGTGLGLSICYGIITEHGGRIYAESEPGKGATFIVELPISK